MPVIPREIAYANKNTVKEWIKVIIICAGLIGMITLIPYLIVILK